MDNSDKADVSEGRNEWHIDRAPNMPNAWGRGALHSRLDNAVVGSAGNRHE